MSIIRYGEEGYEAYIYVDSEHKNKINISTPSYKGTVELGQAVKVLHLLIKLEEVPADILDRLFKEIQESLSRMRK